MSEIVSRYPLPGVLAATTEPQRRLIERATEVLGADERVLAAYLVGGFAVGLGDAFSDVDLQCIVVDETVEDLRTSWRALAEQIAELVEVQPVPRTIGGVCVTPDWRRFDLVIHPRSAIDPATVEGMIPLLDKAGLLTHEPLARPSGIGEPFFPTLAVHRFIYMLGNVVAAIGRNEPVPLSNAVLLMRDLGLVPLLLAEEGMESAPPGRRPNPLNPFPFTKRLAPWLSAEHVALLVALPAVGADLDSGIDGVIALARVFLPRARALARRTGATYPDAFEQATIDYFQRSVGIRLELCD